MFIKHWYFLESSIKNQKEFLQIKSLSIWFSNLSESSDPTKVKLMFKHIKVKSRRKHHF